MEEAAEKDGRACGGTSDTKDVSDVQRSGGYAQTKGGIYETKDVAGARAGGYAETKGIPESAKAGGYAETKGIPGGPEAQTKEQSG